MVAVLQAIGFILLGIALISLYFIAALIMWAIAHATNSK